VRLLHDNALVHTSVAVKAAIQCCGFQELNHTPYSPDLVPSDYFLFSKLKSDLRGKKFTSDEEVISAVLDHFKDKNSEYLFSGTQKLINRSNKCIQKKGDYIEK
jgi:histone-lysine N-methyltransferase SETMAR